MIDAKKAENELSNLGEPHYTAAMPLVAIAHALERLNELLERIAKAQEGINEKQ